MPRGEGLNLQGWARRLWGPGTTNEPDVIPSVQPMLSIGDASRLVPPLPVARAIAGGRRQTVVARVCKFDLQCLAPGGLYVDWLLFSAEQGANAAYKLSIADTVNGNYLAQTICVNYDMTPVPTVSRLILGDGASDGLQATTFHVNGSTQNFNTPLPGNAIYLAPGKVLHGEHDDLGIVGFLGIAWTEVPVTPPR